MFAAVFPLVFALSAQAAPAPWGLGYNGGHWHQVTSVEVPPAYPTAVIPAVSSVPAAVPSSTPAGTGGGGEQHVVNLVNNCGAGTEAVFLYQGNGNPQGSTTIVGALKGGVAWVSGYGSCQSSGVNCGTVEFTLINPGDDSANTQSAINYSLQSQGNHQFTYSMDATYTGSCSKGLGACTSVGNCPGAFTGTDTTDGSTQNCVQANAGITITFC